MDTNSRSQDPNESVDREIADIAGSQHGVFGRAQAIECGATKRQIQYRLDSGRWITRLPAVFSVAGGAPLTARGWALAATLWAGPDALVSHGAAAVLWVMEGVRARRVELWVPSSRAKRSPLVEVHRGTRLDRADRTVLDGIPITTPTRTLIDVAGRLEDDALLALTEDMFRRGLTNPSRLAARLLALRGSGRPGAGRLDELLAARPDGAAALESRLEARVWLLLQRSALPLPARQHWVIANGARYRLDFAWPNLRVAVECDGWRDHGGRQRFERDEVRRADLASNGWAVVGVTWAQCSKAPDAFIERVARSLRSMAS